MHPEARRLHRAAIAVMVLGALREYAVPLLVVFMLGVVRGGLDSGALVMGVLYGVAGTAIATITGYVRWENTRWWVNSEGIHRRSGVFSTKQTDIPFSRIQALDVEQGLVQRWFGVHAVHVQTGGGGAEGEIVLEAIGEKELEGLRGMVAFSEAPATGDQRRLSRGALLVAALTAGQVGVIVPVLAGGAQLLQNVLGDEAERDAIRLIPDATHEWVLAAAGLLAIAWLLSVLGALVAFAGFTVSRDGDRLRIRRGVFSRREATIPVARIRAVTVVEGILRRPLRLAALRMEVIGHAKEAAAAQALFPLLRRREVREFLDRLLPELADDVDGLAPLPRRALRRYVLPPAAVAAVAGAAPWPWIGPWGLLAVLPAVLWGWASYRAAGWRLDGDRLAVRRLRVARTTVLAPAARRESHTIAQTVFQRRGRLADLHVAFGKRTTARIHHLEAADADELFAGLTEGPVATGR
jgi:putative membrane protein